MQMAVFDNCFGINANYYFFVVVLYHLTPQLTTSKNRTKRGVWHNVLYIILFDIIVFRVNGNILKITG